MPGQNTQYGRDNYTYSNGAAIAGEAWGAGVQYKNTFGGVGFAASAGYMSTDLQALKDNMREWNVGTDISYAGFNVGGSYRGVRTNYSAADRALTGASAISSPNGRLWEVGAGYTTGPFAVSLQYVDSRADGLINGTTGSAGKDKARIWSLNGAYNMGPGIKLVGAVANVKWRDEAGAGTNSIGENKGWAGITGFEVTF
ncbi:MAG: porin, partial [Rhodospirillales bacterium]|nr:porin [Rhodospirillales bacterium]